MIFAQTQVGAALRIAPLGFSPTWANLKKRPFAVHARESRFLKLLFAKRVAVGKTATFFD